MTSGALPTPTSSTALLQPGTNCWRIEHADRFAFIVDADEYFKTVRAAMLNARKSIFLIGWDFDTRVQLAAEPDDSGPASLGELFLWLVKRTPSLEIRLLRWDTGAFKTLLRGNTLITVLRWMAHRRITIKLDAIHPLAASHHQKIVVIDDKLAFCGGIDITSGRWDQRDHSDNNPRRHLPNGKPYGPWHDATSALSGPAARAMGDLARQRWQMVTGQSLPPCEDATDPWPDKLTPTFEQVQLAIARTIPDMDDAPGTHEIEQIYLDLIASADRFIYAESQYFASRKIARDIAQRLTAPNPPEIVVINPVTAEGWLEPVAMDSARARLVEAIQRLDTQDRFRMYHPVTQDGEAIYVHAKIFVVDDRYLRVGSSNFNNRSMRLDTECDVIVSAQDAQDTEARQTITRLRDDLLAEHLDVEPAQVSQALTQSGSLIAAIESLRRNGRTLTPYVLPELGETEKWLADNEILDPEGPDQMFESLTKRGLFKHWRTIWKR